MLSDEIRPDGPKKNRKKTFLLNAALILTVCLLLYFGTEILKEAVVDAGGRLDYSAAAEEAVVDDGSGEDTIDFVKVRKLGSTAKSWISIADTAVNYPLVQAEDNDYYIDHDAYGAESRAGAIFINAGNKADLSDDKTIIFGHNQADGSMFSTLHKYGDMSWGGRHKNLVITSEDGTVRTYEIMAYLYVKPLDDTVYTIDPAETLDDTAEKLLKKARVKYKDFTGGKIVCLSTCKHHSMRSVAVFELVNEERPAVSTVIPLSGGHKEGN